MNDCYSIYNSVVRIDDMVHHHTVLMVTLRNGQLYHVLLLRKRREILRELFLFAKTRQNVKCSKNDLFFLRLNSSFIYNYQQNKVGIFKTIVTANLHCKGYEETCHLSATILFLKLKPRSL